MSMGSVGRERIFYVGIFCDSCQRQESGDFAASSQRAAEDGLRAELVADKGWSCDAAGDFCGRCRPAPAGLVEEPPAPDEELDPEAVRLVAQERAGIPDKPWDYLPGGGIVTYPSNPELWA